MTLTTSIICISTAWIVLLLLYQYIIDRLGLDHIRGDKPAPVSQPSVSLESYVAVGQLLLEAISNTASVLGFVQPLCVRDIYAAQSVTSHKGNIVFLYHGLRYPKSNVSAPKAQQILAHEIRRLCMFYGLPE